MVSGGNCFCPRMLRNGVAVVDPPSVWQCGCDECGPVRLDGVESHKCTVAFREAATWCGLFSSCGGVAVKVGASCIRVLCWVCVRVGDVACCV